MNCFRCQTKMEVGNCHVSLHESECGKKIYVEIKCPNCGLEHYGFINAADLISEDDAIDLAMEGL